MSELLELRSLVFRILRIAKSEQCFRCEGGRECIAWPAIEVSSDPRLHNRPAEVTHDATESMASPVECGKSAGVSPASAAEAGRQRARVPMLPETRRWSVHESGPARIPAPVPSERHDLDEHKRRVVKRHTLTLNTDRTAPSRCDLHRMGSP
jgi:hypothetical protein